MRQKKQTSLQKWWRRWGFSSSCGSCTRTCRQRCGACRRASAFAWLTAAAGTVANVPCLLRRRNCNDVIISVQRSFTSTFANVLLLNAVDIARVELYTVEVLSTLRPFCWCWSRQLCWRWQLWTLRGSSTLLQLRLSRRLQLASPSPSQQWRQQWTWCG